MRVRGLIDDASRGSCHRPGFAACSVTFSETPDRKGDSWRNEKLDG